MKKFNLTIGNIRPADNEQSEKRRVIEKFPDLFKNNTTIKDTELNIQLKPEHYPVKQKARPIPLHLQEEVGRELEKLIKTGHLEKVKHVDEDCFVSPVVITVKSDKCVKIALDSRKLNDSCIKLRPHMPNMEELLNQNSVEITRDQKKDRPRLRIRSNAIITRDKPTMRICSNGRKLQRILQIQKRILRTCRHSDNIPGKN